MSSPLGNKQNVKVFVLYLMLNVGYPMDFVTINDIIMQTDYVAYLDFAESFSEMKDTELVACVGTNDKGEETYAVTAKGQTVVESMQSHLLPSILDESLTAALRHLDFSRRGVKVSARHEKNPDGGYDLHCLMTERNTTLLEITLRVDSARRASIMEDQFRDRPEQMYRALHALMTGQVNYLFDK
ncbi:MAG: DUF4364 family protein [Clostridia bacterium]|nr:DUF4364 family protein [Clostridia bacterium]